VFGFSVVALKLVVVVAVVAVAAAADDDGAVVDCCGVDFFDLDLKYNQIFKTLFCCCWQIQFSKRFIFTLFIVLLFMFTIGLVILLRLVSF
jgi:hypothetical protein